MKYLTLYLSLLLLTSLFWTSCKDMDQTYKEYVVVGGIKYPGKVLNPSVNSGYNKVNIQWMQGSDPSVVAARIYWNNYSDSIEVPVSQNADSISLRIEDLPENTYSFFIRTYDDLGNSSVDVEVLGRVYGEKFIEGLRNRSIYSSVLDESNQVNIIWENPDLTNGAIGTEIVYTDNGDIQQDIVVGAEENSSLLTNYKKGSEFKYRTLFVPDTTCIDTFYTNFESREVLMKLDKSDWMASCDSYEPFGQLPNGYPEMTIDGDESTYWHTEHSGGMPGYPHWLAYDMKKMALVDKVELTSRSNFLNADFTKFIIQKSDDGITWVDCNEFNLSDVVGAQSFTVTGSLVTRYIRIYMTEGPNPYSHLAEFSVIGRYVD